MSEEEKNAEKLIDLFLEEETSGNPPPAAGPGRPTVDEAAAKDKAAKEAAQAEALRKILPQVMPLLGECARTPWDLWADRMEARYKYKLSFGFLRLTENEADKVGQACLPYLIKLFGPWIADHGPEALALITVAIVTVPRVIHLRRLERTIAEKGLPEAPPKPSPEPSPAPSTAIPEPIPAPAPAPSPKGKKRGRPRK